MSRCIDHHVIGVLEDGSTTAKIAPVRRDVLDDSQASAGVSPHGDGLAQRNDDRFRKCLVLRCDRVDLLSRS